MKTIVKLLLCLLPFLAGAATVKISELPSTNSIGGGDVLPFTATTGTAATWKIAFSNFAAALPAAAGGSIYNSNTVYLTKGGDDGTAEVGNIGKPFASIISAVARLTNQNMRLELGPGVYEVYTSATNDFSSTGDLGYPLILNRLTNVSICGAGMGVSTIRATNVGGVFLLRDCGNIMFRDLTIKGTYDTNHFKAGKASHALVFQQRSNVNLQFINVELRENNDHGFAGIAQQNYCTNTTFLNCRFIQCGSCVGSGIGQADGAGTWISGGKTRVIGCYYENCLRGLELEGEVADYYDVLAIGNNFVNCWNVGIWLSADNGYPQVYSEIAAIGNTFRGASLSNVLYGNSAAIRVNGGNRVILADNHITQLAQDGITCLTGTNIAAFQIVGNTISDIGAGTDQAAGGGIGIYVDAGNAGYTPANMLIARNYIQRTRSHAMMLGLTNSVVRENMIRDWGTNGTSYGICLRTHPTTTTNANVLVEGNWLRMTTPANIGIVVQSNSHSIVLKDNWIDNCTIAITNQGWVATNAVWYLGNRTNATDLFYTGPNFTWIPLGTSQSGLSGIMFDDFAIGGYNYAGIGFELDRKGTTDFSLLGGTAGETHLNGRNLIYFKIGNDAMATMTNGVLWPFTDLKTALGKSNMRWSGVYAGALGGVTNLALRATPSIPALATNDIVIWNSNGVALFATGTNGTKLLLEP